jgi:hypothetical protein
MLDEMKTDVLGIQKWKEQALIKTDANLNSSGNQRNIVILFYIIFLIKYLKLIYLSNKKKPANILLEPPASAFK